MATDPKLVVALEARLNKFEKDLQQAGVIADREVKKIEDRFSRANPSFKGTFFGSFLGNLASQGGKALLDFLGEIGSELKAVEGAAELAGISVEKAFALGRASGNVEGVAALIEKLALTLERVRQGGEGGKLFEIFDANGVKNVKDVQGALAAIADLMQQATPAQRVMLAEAAGAAKELIPFLSKGADEVSRLTAEESKAAVEMQRLAESAKEFDKLWTSALDSITTRIKDLALTVVGAIRSWAEELRNTPLKGPTFDEFMRGRPAAGGTLADRGMGPINGPLQLTVHPRPGTGITIPQDGRGGSETDAFERQEQQIERRRQLLEAETATIGQNEAARQRLRVETELLNAAERAQIEITPELRERINALADAYARTAERAEMARNIMSGTREFGSALADAFKSATLEGQKLDEVLKNLINRLSSRAIDALFNMAFNALGSSLAGGLAPNADGSLAGSSPFGSGFNVLGPRALGGPVAGGVPYLVGERGPEIFVPNSGGAIVPNNVAGGAMGGMTFSPVTNIDARGADAGVETRLRMVLAENNKLMLRQVKQSLPGWSQRQSALGKI